MIVKYIRDGRKPIGAIVGLSPDNIGVSICCPKDRFLKKRAIEIAQGRANNSSSFQVPNRQVVNYKGETVHLVEAVNNELSHIQNILMSRGVK